jgi:hypothetical protein
VAVLWAVLVAVLLTIAEPGSAVAPATSLESAAADAAVSVTGEMISEPVPETSLVARILPVAVVPPGRAAVGGAATAASADDSTATAVLRTASAGIRVGFLRGIFLCLSIGTPLGPSLAAFSL